MGSGVEGWDAGRQQLDRLKLHEIGASGLPSASRLSCHWLVPAATAARFAGAAGLGWGRVRASAAPHCCSCISALLSRILLLMAWLGKDGNLGLF